MFLSELGEKQGAKIAKNSFSGDFSRRLRDMGFAEGEKVLCVRKSVFSSPIIYRIKGSNIALRKKDAQRIEVIF